MAKKESPQYMNRALWNVACQIRDLVAQVDARSMATDGPVPLFGDTINYAEKDTLFRLCGLLHNAVGIAEKQVSP